MLNIIFMGTPDFAKESLEAIYNAGHNILAVVTNPDRPKGRGMKMLFSPVKEVIFNLTINCILLKLYKFYFYDVHGLNCLLLLKLNVFHEMILNLIHLLIFYH